MKRRTYLLLALSFIACAASQDESVEHDIQEVVLRWAFRNAETDLAPPAVHCVSISRGARDEANDPEPRFLTRFNADSVLVKPQSACQYIQGAHHSVVEKSSGEFGLLFIVYPLEQVGENHAKIGVGFVQGGTWGVDWRCNVRRETSGWTVEDCRRIAES